MAANEAVLNTLNVLKVPVLQQLCKEKGVSKSGVKHALVERLAGTSSKELLQLLKEHGPAAVDAKLGRLMCQLEEEAAEDALITEDVTSAVALPDASEVDAASAADNAPPPTSVVNHAPAPRVTAKVNRAPAPSVTAEESEEASGDEDDDEEPPASALHRHVELHMYGPLEGEQTVTKVCLHFEDPLHSQNVVGRYGLSASKVSDNSTVFSHQIGPSTQLVIGEEESFDSADRRVDCRLLERSTGFEQVLVFKNRQRLAAFQRDFQVRSKVMGLAHKVSKLTLKIKEAHQQSAPCKRIFWLALTHVAALAVGAVGVALSDGNLAPLRAALSWEL